MLGCYLSRQTETGPTAGAGDNERAGSPVAHLSPEPGQYIMVSVTVVTAKENHKEGETGFSTKLMFQI